MSRPLNQRSAKKIAVKMESDTAPTLDDVDAKVAQHSPKKKAVIKKDGEPAVGSKPSIQKAPAVSASDPSKIIPVKLAFGTSDDKDDQKPPTVVVAVEKKKVTRVWWPSQKAAEMSLREAENTNNDSPVKKTKALSPTKVTAPPLSAGAIQAGVPKIKVASDHPAVKTEEIDPQSHAMAPTNTPTTPTPTSKAKGKAKALIVVSDDDTTPIATLVTKRKRHVDLLGDITPGTAKTLLPPPSSVTKCLKWTTVVVDDSDDKATAVHSAAAGAQTTRAREALTIDPYEFDIIIRPLLVHITKSGLVSKLCPCQIIFHYKTGNSNMALPSLSFTMSHLKTDFQHITLYDAVCFDTVGVYANPLSVNPDLIMVDGGKAVFANAPILAISECDLAQTVQVSTSLPSLGNHKCLVAWPFNDYMDILSAHLGTVFGKDKLLAYRPKGTLQFATKSELCPYIKECGFISQKALRTMEQPPSNTPHTDIRYPVCKEHNQEVLIYDGRRNDKKGRDGFLMNPEGLAEGLSDLANGRLPCYLNSITNNNVPTAGLDEYYVALVGFTASAYKPGKADDMDLDLQQLSLNAMFLIILRHCVAPGSSSPTLSSPTKQQSLLSLVTDEITPMYIASLCSQLYGPPEHVEVSGPMDYDDCIHNTASMYVDDEAEEGDGEEAELEEEEDVKEAEEEGEATDTVLEEEAGEKEEDDDDAGGEEEFEFKLVEEEDAEE
ncbi:hypothetical protein BDN71DRAFT_1430174 [Pleurotus eryngii]|uniref:Uncharacterized protein n=1 Tax=Pleurotus eryngii TaxID=5323 RepID=A0A9P6D857_PLEER|nr:hypothetical protein BDN71DRAFT_1430174 [Pleurotus eryngii]